MTVLKQVLFFLFFLTASVNLFSQFSIGMRGGITFPDVAFGEDVEQEGVDYFVFMGGTIGVVAEWKLSEHFAIQPELMLTQKGFKIDYRDYYGTYYYYGSPTEETKFRLNYLEIPILAKGMFGNDFVNGYLAAGPVWGYASSAARFENGEKRKFEEEDWEGLKRSELSASLGAGVEMAVNTGKVFLDLRYLFGLSNITSDDGFKAWNRTFGVSVGYMMNL